MTAAGWEPGQDGGVTVCSISAWRCRRAADRWSLDCETGRSRLGMDGPVGAVLFDQPGPSLSAWLAPDLPGGQKADDKTHAAVWTHRGHKRTATKWHGSGPGSCSGRRNRR